jgi:hypothetical protein
MQDADPAQVLEDGNAEEQAIEPMNHIHELPSPGGGPFVAESGDDEPGSMQMTLA